MKHKKDRVIAIDYFRGICILVVLLNHSSLFSRPLNYVAGGGSLWTSAAEMFFLLSGITLGVVRGSKIRSDFRAIAKKTWRRAGELYLINSLVVLASLCIALFFSSHNLANDIPGAISTQSSVGLMARIMNFSYSIGWANFLMYYAVFLLFAPFALYVLRTKFWTVVPLLSIAVFAAGPALLGHGSTYAAFAVWQIYFYLGLTLARLRAPIISWFYGLKQTTHRKLSTAVIGLAALSVAASLSLSQVGQRFAGSSWLPAQAQTAYSALLSHQQAINHWLLNNRTGILRPLASLLMLAAVYLFYQKYKQPLLARTGRFVNAMGRDTLWIFVAQAMAIPLLAAIPLRRNLFNNLLLTTTLMLLMWSVTRRRAMAASFRLYAAELKTSYSDAKNAYLYRSENSS